MLVMRMVGYAGVIQQKLSLSRRQELVRKFNTAIALRSQPRPAAAAQQILKVGLAAHRNRTIILTGDIPIAAAHLKTLPRRGKDNDRNRLNPQRAPRQRQR